MPTLSAGELTLLRTTPHKSKLYMVVQQPMTRSGSSWTGYLWSCQVNGNPAGSIGDLIASITVDNGDAGGTDLFDGMTIFIGTNKGDHDKGVFVVRTDQLGVDNATVTLNIGSSSEVVGIVADDDWIVVLDEFRLWTRYPRITEAGGVLTWYKDYDLLYDDLGADAGKRREASLPPVPVMGPPAVRFIDVGGTVDIDFDWSDSYPTYPGATITNWDSQGIRGSIAGDWVSAAQDPAAKTYDGSNVLNSDISGMAGFRVWLELTTDVQDPAARFRRGVRYVFTLRRPGESSGQDPINAEPIVDFEITSLSGSYDEGSWRASATVFDTESHEYNIWEGALVVIFADDWYGETETNIGPIDDRENILFVGRIADGTVRQDSETGDTSFDIVSVAGQAQNRDMYPVVVENLDSANKWYEVPDLTVDRAAWFFLIWHSTLPLISDWYWSEDTHEIRAMDFLAGDIYSTIDSFYQDRIFARFLCDRYERNRAEIDLQLEIQGSGTTILTVDDGDTVDDVQFREVTETPVSIVELGGINYNSGLIIPYLTKAPGTVNRNKGSSFQNTSMAITDQATLNLLAGRMLAKMNNQWPEATLPFAGNWRAFDIWPQEYVVLNTVTDRHTFASDNFIVRRIDMAYENETVFVTVGAEMETGGISGQTIDIPTEPPPLPPPPVPVYPPVDPPTPVTPGQDSGRRIIATTTGVYVTDDIGATPPLWYAANNGLSTADDLYVWDIKRDPFHWWTSGGTERTLWALTKTGVWKHEDFPYGTWAQQVTMADFVVAGAQAESGLAWYGRMNMSIEVEDRYALTYWNTTGGAHSEQYVSVLNGAVIANIFELYGTNDGNGWGAVMFAPHQAGNVIYAVGNRAPCHAGSSEAFLTFTPNAGAAWQAWPGIDSRNTGNMGLMSSISIPYIDATNPDAYILWGRGGSCIAYGRYTISDDQGATFNDLPLTENINNYSHIGTGGHPDYIFLLAYSCLIRQSKWTNNRGLVYNELPAIGVDEESYAAFVRWNGGELFSVLVGTIETYSSMYLWESGSSTWIDKTGNLADFLPTAVHQVDRDSMGTA